MTKVRSRIIAVIVTAAVALACSTLYVLRPQSVAAWSIERLPAYHDPVLMRRAWSLPVARLYRPDFVFQSNPSICGPTSIADVLNSEGQRTTPTRVLDGSGIRSIFGLLPGGLTLDEEATLVRLRTHQPIAVLRGLSLTDFRREVAKSNDPARRIIVNFTRDRLFGRGHGHFSPVLGYLPERDLVFVGDVNANYRPWLTPVARLYAAQDTVDPASHAKRGLLEISAP